MRKLVTYLLALAAAAIISPLASAADAEDTADMAYHNMLGRHFEVSSAVVDSVLEVNQKLEELAVSLLVAKAAKTTPVRIATLRARGENWMDILKGRYLKPDIFYFLISGDISSKTYGPIFKKYKETPKSHWGMLELSDQEINDLVNLKAISSGHDFSVFDVMAMRDKGKSFVKISEQVAQIIEKRAKEEKLRSIEAAKAEKGKK